MNSKVPVIPLVAALVMGAAGGYSLGRGGRLPAVDPEVTPPEPFVRTELLPAARAEAAAVGWPAGSLVPISFADLMRELSLLQSLAASDRSNRLFDLARAVHLDDPAAVLSLAGGKLVGMELTQFQTALVERWARSDPAGALTWAQRQASAIRSGLVTSVVQSWVKRDVAAAMAFVGRTEDPQFRATLRMAAINGLADQDPSAAWALVEQVANVAERKELAAQVLPQLARREGPRAMKLAAEFLGTAHQGQGVQNVLRGWLEVDAAGARDWLLAQPAGLLRHQWVSQLAGDFARSSPEPALELVKTLPMGSLRDEAMNSVIREWMSVDAEAAMRWVEATGDRQLQQAGMNAALEHWARVNPARAVALLAKVTDSSNDREGGHHAMVAQNWAARDPAAALAWAKALPSGRQAEIIGIVLGQLATSDPQAALAQATELTDPRARRQALQAVTGEWSNQDATAAARWVVEQPDRRLVADLVPAMVQRLALTDPAGAEALLDKLPPGNARTSGLSILVNELAAQNLPDALALVERLPKGSMRDTALQQLGWSWGQRDPDAAAKYALAQPETEGRGRLLDAVAAEWARRDPAAGVEFWKQLTPGPSRDSYTDNLTRQWAEADPQGAMKWVTSLPTADQRPELMSGIIQAWAQQSPADAAAYAGKLPADQQSAAVGAVLQAYGEQDPATGAKWLESFADESLRQEVQNPFVFRWAQEDPVAAAEWLRTQPEGPSRQSAIEGFARSVVEREPASAWQWAAAVGDEQVRANVQRDVIDRWLKVDPEAAQRAVNALEAPEDFKAELRKGR